MTAEVVCTGVALLVILLKNINDPTDLDNGIIVLLVILIILPGAFMLPCMKLCCSSGQSSNFLEEEIPLSHMLNVRREGSRSLPDMWAGSIKSHQPDFGTI